MSADIDTDCKRHIAGQGQPHEVDPRRGRTLLGCADSDKRTQPICTQSAVAPLFQNQIALNSTRVEDRGQILHSSR